MGVPMHQCPFCDKRMPKHILSKHLEKTHPDAPIQNWIKKETSTEPVTSTEKPKGNTTFLSSDKWDAGEIQECRTCHETYPAKIMPFHVKLIHGL